MLARPLASLGLVGDGDESDIVRDLERAFSVDFGTRPEAWTTVGDIERDLLALYPAASAAGRCGSAMAFRRLRAALSSTAYRARPDTPLASLVPGTASRRLDRSLRNAGLVVHASQGGIVAGLGALTALAGLVLLTPLILLGHAGPAAALLVGGIALVALDRGVPRDATLGDLARETAATNFAHFAERGADRRRPEIWAAIRRIVAQTACVAPGTIDRETRFFD